MSVNQWGTVNQWSASIVLPIVDAGVNLTGTIGDTVTISGATASDYDSLLWTCESGQSPTFSDATVLNPDVTFNESGLHVLRLTATNADGSAFDELSATVQAVDTTKPVITLLGSASVTITEGDTYTDAGATALDDTDGDITANIVTVNPVDVNTPATYIVTYNVSDAAGNAADEVARTVVVEAEVIPNQPPTANAGPDQSVAAGVLVQVSASGSSDGDGTIVGYKWRETTNSGITLSSTTAENISFTSPVSDTAQTVTLELIVTDDDGVDSAPVYVDFNIAAEVVIPTFSSNVIINNRYVPDGDHYVSIIIEGKCIYDNTVNFNKGIALIEVVDYDKNTPWKGLVISDQVPNSDSLGDWIFGVTI